MDPSKVGTTKYMAPEILLSIPYKGAPADIFALGVTLFYLAMGFPPFSLANVHKSKHYEFIAKERKVDLWNLYLKSNPDSNATEEFKNLFIKLLSAFPEERPECKQILEDPWMTIPIVNQKGIIEEFKKKESEIIAKKQEITNKSKQAFNKKKKNEEEKKIGQIQGFGNNLGRGNTIKMEEKKIIRKYNRPFGFITAQELDFEAQYIIQSILNYVYLRSGNTFEDEKYMSVLCDLMVNGEYLRFNAEVMKDKNINVLVLDKKEGDKLDFLLIYNEIVKLMIDNYC